MPEGAEVLVENVSRAIGEVELLPATSVTVPPGTCLWVRGPNGAGKTTLLRLVAGLDRPTTGRITIDARPADERNRHHRAAAATLIGPVVPYRDLTVHDHLTLVDATWGADPTTSPQRVEEALTTFTIAELADRYPHELSTGQSQLFQLSLVWLRPARLLILDEPEQGLDTSRRARLQELLRTRRDSGTTIVMASHDPALAGGVADAILDLGPHPT